jgi:hypothetical protein
VALAVLVCLGCSGGSKIEGIAPVTGTVTMNGSPVEGATVIFAPAGQGSRSASGKTDASGKFSLTTLQPGDGAMPGDYTVMVTKTEVTESKKVSDDEATEIIRKTGKPPVTSQTKNLLPAKYGDIAKSDLKATVKKGQKNDIPLDLKP